jgi:hypothetical protein
MSWYGRKNFQKFWELIAPTIDAAVNKRSATKNEDEDEDDNSLDRMKPTEMKSKLPTERVTRQHNQNDDVNFPRGGMGRGNFPMGRGQGMGGNRRNRF